MPSSRWNIVRPACLPGVEVWHNRLEAMLTGGVFADFSVGAMRGPSRWSYRGSQTERHGAYIMTVQPEECCPVEILGSFESRIVFINRAVMRNAADERGLRPNPAFRSVAATDDEAWQRIRIVVEAAETSASTLTQQVAFVELLERVFARYVDASRETGDGVEHRAVRRMRDLIRERFAENLTLDEIAGYVGLNKFYALRAFRQTIGVPPNAYQRHIRIAKAREMLRTGHGGVDLALELGFCDQSHFDRWFRRITHLTPTEYRRGR